MMPSDPIQAMEFAQSKGQAHKEGRTGITLADVAGLDPIVGRLQQVRRQIRHMLHMKACICISHIIQKHFTSASCWTASSLHVHRFSFAQIHLALMAQANIPWCRCN